MAGPTVHHISPSLHIAYSLDHPPTPPASPRPTIILINGLADKKETWAAQIPAFTSAGYSVLTYDNRGVGASTRPSSPGEVYTAADMAADLASLLSGLRITGQAHVLGVSMGGMIAQSFALNHVLGVDGDGESESAKPAVPGLDVLSVTFACTYAAPGPFCTRMFRLWEEVAQRMSVATVIRDVTLWCFSPAFFADPRRQQEIEAIDADIAGLDAPDAHGGLGVASYLAQLNVILQFDSRPAVAVLGHGGASTVVRHEQTPRLPRVVVLAGESDILIPVALSRQLYELIPGATWRTTRGGHACNWEFPDDFNRTCLEAWREVEGGL